MIRETGTLACPNWNCQASPFGLASVKATRLPTTVPEGYAPAQATPPPAWHVPPRPAHRPAGADNNNHLTVNSAPPRHWAAELLDLWPDLSSDSRLRLADALRKERAR